MGKRGGERVLSVDTYPLDEVKAGGDLARLTNEKVRHQEHIAKLVERLKAKKNA